MKTMMRCFLMVVGFITISTQLVAQWEPANGPVGSQVYDIILLNTSGNPTLLAATIRGVFRSTNYGESWTESGLKTSYSMFTVVKQTNTAPIIFMLSGKVIFKSTDYGNTWSELTKHLSKYSNTLHAISRPGNSTALYASSHDSLFVSINLGEMWKSCGVITPNWQINDVMQCREKLFVATAKGLFFTTNDGVSWSSPNLSYEINNLTSVVTSSGDTVLFAQQINDNYPSYSLFRSTDFGNSWTKLNWSKHIIGFNTIDGDLYVSDNITLFRSTNLGETWSTAFSELPSW